MADLVKLLNQILATQQHMDETLTSVLAVLARQNTGQPPAVTEWLSIEQAAEVAGISATTIRPAVRKGKLQASNVGCSTRRPTWRIHRVDLDAFLKANVAGSHFPATLPKSIGKYKSRHFSDL